MIDLRCDKHMHMRVDPESGVIEVKCSQCSKAQKMPVYHAWRMIGGKIIQMDGGTHGNAGSTVARVGGVG